MRERTTVTITAVLFGAVVLGGCAPDEIFSQAVQNDFDKRGGPVATCCIRHASTASCKVDAETQCSYAKDAKLSMRVDRINSGSALVHVDLAGPHGRGKCTLNVADDGKRRGGIQVAGGTCERVP